jgi:hypothetical protein
MNVKIYSQTLQLDLSQEKNLKLMKQLTMLLILCVLQFQLFGLRMLNI